MTRARGLEYCIRKTSGHPAHVRTHVHFLNGDKDEHLTKKEHKNSNKCQVKIEN